MLKKTAECCYQVGSSESSESHSAPVVPISVVVRQEPLQSVTSAQFKTPNHKELSAAMQRSLEASVYDGYVSSETLCEASPHSFVPHMLATRPSPPSYSKVLSHMALIARFGGDGARLRASTLLDFYMASVAGSSSLTLSTQVC